MAEPTRLDVYNKLETLSDLTKAQQKEAITLWLEDLTTKPEMVLNDLESYSNYGSKERTLDN